MEIGIVIIQIVIILISLTVHEAAHAFASYRLGDPTAHDLGRMSLNPIVHIDPIGTIVLPVILALSGGAVFGWAKPVPVNPGNLKNPRKDDGIIAAAGPLSNLALALTAAIVWRILNEFSGDWVAVGVGYYVVYILHTLMFINVILALLNLIPIPPLDGASVFGAVLPLKHAIKLQSIGRYGFLILLGLIFFNILDQFYLIPVGNAVVQILMKIVG